LQEFVEVVSAWLDRPKPEVFLSVEQYWKKGLYALLEDKEYQSYYNGGVEDRKATLNY
jgi:hypothetical protein